MVRLECQEYAQKEAFKTGSKVWYDEIKRINEWEENYKFKRGCKDLFYSLLQTGLAFTTDETRAINVLHVLQDNGYLVKMESDIRIVLKA